MSNYLDLLKVLLTGYAFPESAYLTIRTRPGYSPKTVLINSILKFAAKRGWRIQKIRPFDKEGRENGIDWPSIGYTMVGLKRLDNVQMAIETVIRENIPGDICECGVWRGGCGIFMKAVLATHNVKDRVIWLADSFEGLPKPDVANYPADEGYDLSQFEILAVSQETVKENFERFDLMDDKVKFLKGWFSQSLPKAPIEKLSVLRADGDLYESTMDILNNLYSKVSPGGFVIIDDYNAVEPCKLAVTEFREKNKITAPIHVIDRHAVYWRK